MSLKTLITAAVISACSITVLSQPHSAHGQAAAPGPYEIIPLQDAYIIEAFCDLLPHTSSIADWTGWISSTWITPNAYNNHGGTDFSVGTGTPLYATCDGEVIEVVNNIPDENHNLNYYGNYVKIRPNGQSPQGQTLTILTAHMRPSIQVQVGDIVQTGDFLGYSGNTGNSTSEHLHFESAEAGTIRCPFYYAHFKYPIILNPTATKQVGHILRVSQPTTPIRSSNTDNSSIVASVYENQLLFASFAKQGYYRVFIPNFTAYRSAWVRATDVEEIYTGTVIQPLPDAGVYNHYQQLNSTYTLRESPDANSTVVGTIHYAGGRFVADQTAPGGWYRIPIPATTERHGWVQANNRLVVYPEPVNPDIDLNQRPNDQFPMINNFEVLGPLDYGRPKFDRRSVIDWDDNPNDTIPPRRVLKLTDHGNTGSGHNESISYGRPEHTDYSVQADVYTWYRPSYGGNWNGSERYGIFLRDDGFGGFDETFEGAGNCYLMMYNAQTALLTCGKSINGAVTPFHTFTLSGNAWRTFRIEAQGTTIRYFLDNNPIHTAQDNTFHSGLSGMNYTGRLGFYPALRGAHFDNFRAELLPGSSVADWSVY